MAELRKEGAFCFKVWGSEHMMAGLPDIIGCYRGYFFALEVKEPSKRDNVSKIQMKVQREIARAGGVVAVVVWPEEAVAVLHKHLDL